MTLTLDHGQRMNLHALLGAQRADVNGIRVTWAIQDRIALDADEEKEIDVKREIVSGRERVTWNPAVTLPPVDFELTDSESARLKGALATWDSYGLGADRPWLAPLIGVLFPDEANQVAGTRVQQRL